jgi:hypothetical protein
VAPSLSSTVTTSTDGPEIALYVSALLTRRVGHPAYLTVLCHLAFRAAISSSVSGGRSSKRCERSLLPFRGRFGLLSSLERISLGVSTKEHELARTTHKTSARSRELRSSVLLLFRRFEFVRPFR